MNKLLKTLVFDNQLSLSVLDTTEMVNKAIEIHKLTPVCAAALGRTMTVCTFMSGTLKNKSDRLSVTVAGNGPCGKITVCGNGDLQMRGTVVNPFVELPLKPNGKLDVGTCVGHSGRITVVRSMGLKEPYSGSAQIVSGEIAEDFTAYYAFSEQQPTAMALGVNIGREGKCIGAGGVIIQALPNAEEKNLIRAEEIINGLSNVSSVITEIGAEGIMQKYFGVNNYETYYPKYECLCNRDYIKGILISLGKSEVRDILEKEGAIKVNCEFCGSVYSFDEKDVEEIFK